MFPSVVLWAFRTGLSKTLGSHSPYNGVIIHLCYWDHRSTFTRVQMPAGRPVLT